MLEQRTERLKARLAEPDVRKRLLARCAATSRARINWCPLEYRDEYRRLAGLFPAKDARAIIESQIAVDMRRYEATGKLQQAAHG